MKVIKAFSRKKYTTCHKLIYINCFMDRTNIYFIKNGKIHNSKQPAEIEIVETKYIFYPLNKTIRKYYYLYDKYYSSKYTNKYWKIKAKNILRSNKLKVFR